MKTTLSVLALGLTLLVPSASFAADGFWRIEGKWNNDRSGENIVITPNALGGWEIWSSDFGQGRISEASFEGANIKVEGRGFACFFYATRTAGAKMNWQLRSGTSEICPNRIFTRAE